MTTDRILGNAKGPWAWMLCLVVLGIAIGAIIEYLRLGGALYLTGGTVLAGLAVTGMLRLRAIRRQDV
jgi:hypothetical protein